MRAKQVYEFVRNSDPLDTLGIGKYAPKHFETIDELNNHIIAHLSDIFSGNVPKDLIKQSSTGRLMYIDYFNKIVKYYDNKKYSFYGQEHFEDLSYMPFQDKNDRDWRYFLEDLIKQKLIPLGYEQ